MRRIDMHFHVGLRGNRWPKLGSVSARFLNSVPFKVFRRFGKFSEAQIGDDYLLHDALKERITAPTQVDGVVCLALDKAHTPDGKEVPRGAMWVSNEYVFQLHEELGDRALPGISVHPFRSDFRERVARLADKNPVLMKWLPSTMMIPPWDPRVGDAMEYLATAGPRGRPLPLLIHVGPEHGIPEPAGFEGKCRTFDYLSWKKGARRPRGAPKPDVAGTLRNLRRARDAGGIIILAHSGLRFYPFEHSDLDTVLKLLRENGPKTKGRIFADVSALAWFVRWSSWKKLAKDRYKEWLLFGSDFAVPVTQRGSQSERAADYAKRVLGTSSLKRMRADTLCDRILRLIPVPSGSLVDATHREMVLAFGSDHPVFTNFNALLPGASG